MTNDRLLKICRSGHCTIVLPDMRLLLRAESHQHIHRPFNYVSNKTYGTTPV